MVFWQEIETNELNISNNVEIENPVYIYECVNGNICITCAPNDEIEILSK